MNCKLPVYREAYKLFLGTPSEVWHPLLERYVNTAIVQLDRIRETTEQGTGLLARLLRDGGISREQWESTE